MWLIVKVLLVVLVGFPSFCVVVGAVASVFDRWSKGEDAEDTFGDSSGGDTWAR